ncbi:hypothetical protein AMECASPLE_018073 [Ameca splendens]|uniref:Uncharacterized protein n=1 Tax=Ameca splendens TaxID=208324 RepID=A0ABV0YER1_9TELE
MEEELPVREQTKCKSKQYTERDENEPEMHDTDEELTYHYNLRSRIPCYGFVNTQQIPTDLHQNPEQEEPLVIRQNQGSHTNLRATAEEFCPSETGNHCR